MNGDNVISDRAYLWSNQLALRCVQTVRVPNWRETLHKLIVYCIGSKQVKTPKCRKVSYARTSKVALKFTPFVSLCDVVKYKPSEVSELDQRRFAERLGLKETEGSGDKLPITHETNNALYRKPITLFNSPQVPFSSDIGQELIKKWHKIPEDTHVRKLEKLERYLITDNTMTPAQKTDPNFEITYNKPTGVSHVYWFPTKVYHPSGKLPVDVRHLLTHYCKPCSVRLVPMDLTKKPNQTGNILRENVPRTWQPINTFQRKSAEASLENFDSFLNVSVMLTPMNGIFPTKTYPNVVRVKKKRVKVYKPKRYSLRLSNK